MSTNSETSDLRPDAERRIENSFGPRNTSMAMPIEWPAGSRVYFPKWNIPTVLATRHDVPVYISRTRDQNLPVRTLRSGAARFRLQNPRRLIHPPPPRYSRYPIPKSLIQSYGGNTVNC